MNNPNILKDDALVVKRAKSFGPAIRGLWLFLKTTPNAWIQLAVMAVAIFFGFYCDIPKSDWLALIFASGLVIVTEALNTAIEIDINLTSACYHPYARDTKDVAAGAVLISVLIAVVVGLFIFLPYLLKI